MDTKTAFILDSTTIIPDDFVDTFHYEVVPLHVMVDGIDRPENIIKDEEIVSKLENTKLFTATLKSSSPSTGEFQDAVDKLFGDGYEDIIVLTLSRNNSATYNVANIVIQGLEDEQKKHIFNIDTLINNYGLSNVLSALSPWYGKNIPAAELAEKAQQYSTDSHLAFTLLDLVHLFRGGRLSKISCAIGLLFRIKPVIEMIDGGLVLTKKERTAQRIISYFMDLVADYSGKFKKVFCRYIYLGENKQYVDQMIKDTVEKYKNVEISLVDRVGPVFLVHLGNDGFGLTLTGVNDQ